MLFFLRLHITTYINFFVPTNMDKLTKTYKLRLTSKQLNTLQKLDELGICPSKFIRLAIKEKLEREKSDLLPRKLSLVKVKERYF